jgi:glycosyltransferase involved in cell wall biosynthesis
MVIICGVVKKASDMPDATVVVPTHNRSAMLATTLRSVLWQRDVSLEVIVVDDGSTDGTAQILSSISDGRLRVLRNDTPRGVSAARNRGLAEATGEWVAFVDDDDLWAPDKIVRQLNAAVEAGREWVYTGKVNVNASTHIISGGPPPPPELVARLILRYNAVPGGGSNVVVRRDALAETGSFDLRLRNTEDWEMWIRLAKRGPPAWVPRPLLAYRVHTGMSSLDIDSILAGITLIEARHGIRADRAFIHRWIAESCLRTGRRRQAARYLTSAALRGQARAVGDDLLMIIRRRLNRGSPGHTIDGSGPDTNSGWVSEAALWLRGLAAH